MAIILLPSDQIGLLQQPLLVIFEFSDHLAKECRLSQAVEEEQSFDAGPLSPATSAKVELIPRISRARPRKKLARKTTTQAKSTEHHVHHVHSAITVGGVSL